jgi:Holliday junction resolvase RusA-like endonuclease
MTPTLCAIVNLPTIFSVNGARVPARVGGKFRLIDSPKYARWKRDMANLVDVQRPGHVAGPYALTITVSKKWRGDLGNVEKAVSDVLQDRNVIENDRLAQKIVIVRGDVEGVTAMVVSTKEAE